MMDIGIGLGLSDFGPRLSDFTLRLSDFTVRLSDFTPRLSDFDTRLSDLAVIKSEWFAYLLDALRSPKKSAFAPVCTRQAAYEPEVKVNAPPLSPEGSDRDLERAARMPRHL